MVKCAAFEAACVQAEGGHAVAQQVRPHPCVLQARARWQSNGGRLNSLSLSLSPSVPVQAAAVYARVLAYITNVATNAPLAIPPTLLQPLWDAVASHVGAPPAGSEADYPLVGACTARPGPSAAGAMQRRAHALAAVHTYRTRSTRCGLCSGQPSPARKARPPCSFQTRSCSNSVPYV